MENKRAFARVDQKGDELVVSVGGTIDQMCGMVAGLVTAIANETGEEYKDILYQVSYLTQCINSGREEADGYESRF